VNQRNFLDAFYGYSPFDEEGRYENFSGFREENFLQMRSRLVGSRSAPFGKLSSTGQTLRNCYSCKQETIFWVCNQCVEASVDDFAALPIDVKASTDVPEAFKLRYVPTVADVIDVEDLALRPLVGQWIHHGNASGFMLKARTQYWIEQRFVGIRPWSDPNGELPDEHVDTGRSLQGLSLLCRKMDTPMDETGFFVKKWSGGWWVPRQIIKGLERQYLHILEQMAYGVVMVTLKKALEQSLETDDPTLWAATARNRWQPFGPLPQLPEHEISPREAEHFAQRVMLFLGEPDSKVTRQSNDGGVDVLTRHFVVQVKHQTAPIGPAIVRETHGVAVAMGRTAVVMARTGFTPGAINFANEVGILLFSYDPSLVALSSRGKLVLEGGVPALDFDD
jgi:hypothetical protein